MTETTQPDPQVVAWMREYLREHPGISQYAAVLAGTAAFRRGAFSHLITSWDLADAYSAARTPLTVADIPAGQGPASLFLRPDPAHPGELDLMFKHADGRAVLVGVTVNQLSMDVIDALEAHLAATLPHVTAEEDA